MSILTDIIATLDLSAEVRDIRQGVFHTGVLTRRCGLAATLPKDALKQTSPLIKEPGRLLEKKRLRTCTDVVFRQHPRSRYRHGIDQFAYRGR
jgi:hypothetical protein